MAVTSSIQRIPMASSKSKKPRQRLATAELQSRNVDRKFSISDTTKETLSTAKESTSSSRSLSSRCDDSVGSNNSSSCSLSNVTTELLNDMASPAKRRSGTNRKGLDGSAHSMGDSSWGESSMSSFLSVLLEDEDVKLGEISIVTDNPKPEQQSVQELRKSFIQAAYNNDKPKCRWEYLTRDNNDREQLNRCRRRSMMESRSNSFSGPIEEAREKAPANKKQHMIDSNGNSTKSGSGSNGIEGMFLRMPVRHDSPISAAVKKKALMTRCNMSDGDLSLLPIDPGDEPITPRQRRGTKRITTASSKSTDEPREDKGLSRSGDYKVSLGSAKRNKERKDTKFTQRRRRNSNEFLDCVMEPESDNMGCWPSPIANSAGLTTRNNNFQQLADLSMLYESSESSNDDDEKDISKKPATRSKSPYRVPLRSVGAKQTRRSSGSHMPSRIMYESSESSSESSESSYDFEEEIIEKSKPYYKAPLQSTGKKQTRRSSGTHMPLRKSGETTKKYPSSPKPKSKPTVSLAPKSKQSRRSSNPSIELDTVPLRKSGDTTKKYPSSPKPKSKSTVSIVPKSKQPRRYSNQSFELDSPMELEPPLSPSYSKQKLGKEAGKSKRSRRSSAPTISPSTMRHFVTKESRKNSSEHAHRSVKNHTKRILAKEARRNASDHTQKSTGDSSFEFSPRNPKSRKSIGSKKQARRSSETSIGLTPFVEITVKSPEKQSRRSSMSNVEITPKSPGKQSRRSSMSNVEITPKSPGKQSRRSSMSNVEITPKSPEKQSRRSSISKQTRRLSGSSRAPRTLKEEKGSSRAKTPEKYGSRPPQISTRQKAPKSPKTPSSRKNRISLADVMLSPLSPRENITSSSRRNSLQGVSPLNRKSSKQNETPKSWRKSLPGFTAMSPSPKSPVPDCPPLTSKSPKMKASKRHNKKTPLHDPTPKGEWFSPMDYHKNGF